MLTFCHVYEEYIYYLNKVSLYLKKQNIADTTPHPFFSSLPNGWYVELSCQLYNSLSYVCTFSTYLSPTNDVFCVLCALSFFK